MQPEVVGGDVCEAARASTCHPEDRGCLFGRGNRVQTGVSHICRPPTTRGEKDEGGDRE